MSPITAMLAPNTTFIFALLQLFALSNSLLLPSSVSNNVNVTFERKCDALPTGDMGKLTLTGAKKGVYSQVNCTFVNGTQCNAFPSETGKRKKVSVKLIVDETRKGVGKDSLFHAFVPPGLSICEFSPTIQPKARATKHEAYVSMPFCKGKQVAGNLSLSAFTLEPFSNSFALYTPHEKAFGLRVHYSLS